MEKGSPTFLYVDGEGEGVGRGRGGLGEGDSYQIILVFVQNNLLYSYQTKSLK